jgi:hypothetical protein
VFSSRYTKKNTSIQHDDDGDDDDKLYLTTLTLSAKAGFHNWRVNKSKFTKKIKEVRNYMHICEQEYIL